MDIQDFTADANNDSMCPAQELQADSKDTKHPSNPLASIIAIAGVSFITRGQDGTYTVDR